MTYSSFRDCNFPSTRIPMDPTSCPIAQACRASRSRASRESAKAPSEPTESRNIESSTTTTTNTTTASRSADRSPATSCPGTTFPHRRLRHHRQTQDEHEPGGAQIPGVRVDITVQLEGTTEDDTVTVVVKEEIVVVICQHMVGASSGCHLTPDLNDRERERTSGEVSMREHSLGEGQCFDPSPSD